MPAPQRPKLIITVAPVGSYATTADTPHLPVTPEAIIEDGIACWEAGASILHYHARD
jgi:3-keto-5-aminohexanoate cleavage enzyme